MLPIPLALATSDLVGAAVVVALVALFVVAGLRMFRKRGAAPVEPPVSQGEIERELETIDKQFDGKLPDEPQARWDARVAEKHTHIEDIEAIDARKRELRDRRVGVPTDLQTEPGYEPAPFHVVKQRDLASIYDISRIHRESRDEAHFAQNIRDNAMRSVEGSAFANPHFPRQTGQADVAALLDGKD